MKQSLAPTTVILAVGLALVLAVMLLIWVNAAQAGTTVKSSKSNSSDRVLQNPIDGDRTTVKSSKSNDSDRESAQPSVSEKAATTVKGSKSNSSERGYTVTPTQRGIDKKDVYGPKADAAARKQFFESRSNKVDAFTVKQTTEKEAAAAAAKSKPNHDTAKSIISNIR